MMMMMTTIRVAARAAAARVGSAAAAPAAPRQRLALLRNASSSAMAGKPIVCKAAVARGVNDLRIELVTVAPPKAGEVSARPCRC
jgi:hypothetical protein